MKRILFILLIGMGLGASAQDSLLLDERSFLRMVWDHSPYVRSALLKNEIATFALSEQRAAFQPMLRSNYERKRFNNQLYYGRSSTGVSITTPYALKVKGGYLKNEGGQLNPEAYVPNAGLSYVSVELPLGAGLITDKTRTAVALARLERSGTEAQVTVDLNQFLFKSGVEYWKWYEQILLRELSMDGEAIARERFQFVLAKERLGSYAPIDTLEAFINLQSRQAALQEQEMNFQVQRRAMLTALGKNFLPPMAPVVDPNYRELPVDSAWRQLQADAHPLLQILRLQQQSTEAKQRLVREYFKPQVDLKYSMQQDASEPFLTGYDTDENNYLALEFSFPLFLGSQRAQSRQLKAKAEILELEQEFFSIRLFNELEANQAQLDQLDSTRRVWGSAADNFLRLLEAEQRKFFLGASTNFLVNTRELQYLDARRKYIKAYVAYRIAGLERYYLLGLLPEVVDLMDPVQ